MWGGFGEINATEALTQSSPSSSWLHNPLTEKFTSYFFHLYSFLIIPWAMRITTSSQKLPSILEAKRRHYLYTLSPIVFTPNVRHPYIKKPSEVPLVLLESCGVFFRKLTYHSSTVNINDTAILTWICR